jgi:hypothetical protein
LCLRVVVVVSTVKPGLLAGSRASPEDMLQRWRGVIMSSVGNYIINR